MKTIRMDDAAGFERLEREYEAERDRDKDESVLVDLDYWRECELEEKENFQ